MFGRRLQCVIAAIFIIHVTVTLPILPGLGTSLPILPHGWGSCGQQVRAKFKEVLTTAIKKILF